MANITKKYVRAVDDPEEDQDFDTSDTYDTSDDGFDDMDFGDETVKEVSDDEEKDLDDSLDNISDKLDEINDSLDQYKQDDPNIDVDNNIGDHYIAECEHCHGIFITAVTESDHQIEKVTGKCPLCDTDCDQYLKWVIKDVD